MKLFLFTNQRVQKKAMHTLFHCSCCTKLFKVRLFLCFVLWVFVETRVSRVKCEKLVSRRFRHNFRRNWWRIRINLIYGLFFEFVWQVLNSSVNIREWVHFGQLVVIFRFLVGCVFLALFFRCLLGVVTLVLCCTVSCYILCISYFVSFYPSATFLLKFCFINPTPIYGVYITSSIICLVSLGRKNLFFHKFI